MLSRVMSTSQRGQLQKRRVLVQQQIDALPREQLAASAMPLDVSPTTRQHLALKLTNPLQRGQHSLPTARAASEAGSSCERSTGMRASRGGAGSGATAQ